MPWDSITSTLAGPVDDEDGSADDETGTCDEETGIPDDDAGTADEDGGGRLVLLEGGVLVEGPAEELCMGCDVARLVDGLLVEDCMGWDVARLVDAWLLACPVVAEEPGTDEEGDTRDEDVTLEEAREAAPDEELLATGVGAQGYTHSPSLLASAPLHTCRGVSQSASERQGNGLLGHPSAQAASHAAKAPRRTARWRVAFMRQLLKTLA